MLSIVGFPFEVKCNKQHAVDRVKARKALVSSSSSICVCVCVCVCVWASEECSGSMESSAELSRICVIREIKAPGDLINLPSMLPADPPDASTQHPPTACQSVRACISMRGERIYLHTFCISPNLYTRTILHCRQECVCLATVCLCLHVCVCNVCVCTLTLCSLSPQIS